MEIAKKELIEKYSEIGEISENEDGSLTIGRDDKNELTIAIDDIEEYAKFLIDKTTLENKPNECSIISEDYCEIALEPTNLRSTSYVRHGKGYTFGNEDSDEPYCKIGLCSNTYFNYFRFNEKPNKNYKSKNYRRYSYKDYSDVRRLHWTPITIKIYNLNCDTIDQAIEESNRIIVNSLFALMSLKQVSLTRRTNWEDKRVKRFKLKDEDVGPNLPVRKIKINEELLSYYQLAISADIPASSFLAYYQVLEYHFLNVSNKILHKHITNRINDFRYSNNEKNLNKIINDVNKHKQENDETQMLKSVLKEYVSEDDIIEFIGEYEEFLGHELYTKRRTVFGKDINGKNIKNGDGHSYDVIAKTIKSIRNALVHSTDRYELNERYVPFSIKNTDLIRKEIPLMKYLAEKIIIATSK